MALGLQAGTYKYWGDFTDDNYGFGGEVSLRYDAFSFLGFQLSAGTGSTWFRVTNYDKQSFSDYYKGRPFGDVYPGTLTRLDSENHIRFSHYELTGVFHLFPSRVFNPQLYAGIGVLNHYATNSSEHEPLPNLIYEKYGRYSFIFPVGAGFEYFIGDDVSLNANALFRISTCDWYDDIEDGSSDDYFATISGGIKFYFLSDLDTDGDGMPNAMERKLGLNPEKSDTDGDGVSDYEELNITHTNPNLQDSDGDGLIDGDEIKYKTSPIKQDSDGDGLWDFDEITRGCDPNKSDTDGDGISDGDEIKMYKSNPSKSDSDGDGLHDADEVSMGTEIRIYDTDGDGLSDGTEVHEAQSDPRKKDTDADGLSDAEEFTVQKTDAHNPDTDNDGLLDGEEVTRYKTLPKIADTDTDGWNDGEEVLRRCTNPTTADTDGDGLIDTKDPSPCALSCCCGNCGKQEPAATPKLDTPTPEKPTKQVKPKKNFSIRFKYNSDEIDMSDPETQRSISELKDYLNECDKLKVTLEGHSSTEGNRDRNQVLSEIRAQRIKRYMIDQGINSSKFSGVVGYGGSMPMVAEPTKAQSKRMSKSELESIRKQNRRITVREDIGCE